MGPPKEPSANASIAIGSTGLCSDPSSSNPDGGRTTTGASPSPRKSASTSPKQDLHGRTDGTEDPPLEDPSAQGTVHSEQEKALFNVLEKFMKPRDPTDAPDAWLKLADTAWAYEKDRVERWRNEINTLLVFAGLFSAVLTAFLVQYYAVLLPAPDLNTMILDRILSLQLGNMATNAVVATANSSNPAHMLMVLANSSSTNFTSPPASPPRWIATLWFVALVCSLSSASVGLAVNQWLNFHAMEKAGLQDASQKAWTWQLRRRALDKWKVEYMVSILPFLLQVALVLFLVGIVGYLWELGFDIAVPSTVFVGILLLFLAFTSVSPTLDEYSAYKSPQAWWIYKACKFMQPVVNWVFLQLCRMILLPLDHFNYWILLPLNRLYYWIRALPSGPSPDRPYHIYLQRQKIRDFLIRRQSYVHTLMDASDWLAHEQLCLGNWTHHSDEKSLLMDIYSIVDNTDDLRAMATCVRAMPITQAIEAVTGVGQTVFDALSKRQDPRSRASRPSAPAAGNQLQSVVLDSTSTALIGHMVLDTFTRAHTKLLDLDSNRCIAGLIRAMPLADGTKACMTLFQHINEECLSMVQQRATLDVVQNIYVPVDFLAEDKNYSQHFNMQEARTYDCAPHTELYRLRDVQNWECVKTALTTVYAHRDPVSAIQITTIILAICMFSVKNGHTLPGEPSSGAYLADMLQRFDERLATLHRKDMQDAIEHLPPAVIYRLDWVLDRMTLSASDIHRFSSTTEIRRIVIMSTNCIARRLQWLLECDRWTPPGMVQGFSIDLQAYGRWTRGHISVAGIDTEGWEEWLECAPYESQNEGGQQVDSPHTADPGPTSDAVDEQDPPETQTGSPTRSITQSIVDSVHRLEGSTAQEPDIEKQPVGASSNSAPDVPGATDTAPPVTVTTLDESPQGQGAQVAQTESVQSSFDTDPHSGVAEEGAGADEGPCEEVGSAVQDVDGQRGGYAHPSQEGLPEPSNTPTQPS